MKGHGCLEHYGNFYFMRILLIFANSLRSILAILGAHCGVGLQLILTWLVLWKNIEKTRRQFGWKDAQFGVSTVMGAILL